MFNKFQAKKKNKMTAKASSMKGTDGKPFTPMYGGKMGGKMSNGAGWGGEKMKKGKKKKMKLNPPSKGHKPKGAHGRAAVKALGRTKTTGNFKKIEAAKGKGAAIMAYQNALRAHKGKKSKKMKMSKKMACKKSHKHNKMCMK